VLAADQASPTAPELDDEKTAEERKADTKKDTDSAPAEENKGEKDAAKADKKDKADSRDKPVKPTMIDLAGIESRIVALPLPDAKYIGLAAGKHGSLYYLSNPATLSRWTWEDRKTEKLAEHVESFELSANGDKMLLALTKHNPGAVDAPAGGDAPPPEWVIVPADAPVKPGEGAVSFADLKVRVDPPAEWAQMYHEVWRIMRSYFYDPHYHGYDTVAAERRYEPYVASVTSRADLNYIFYEMLGGFTVGHLRGIGGDIPKVPNVPGGLLGADYTIHNNRYCLAKIYTAGEFNPEVKAPLAQPGLNLSVGDCIVAINGQELTAKTNIQQPLEGTAGHVISLHVESADGKNGREIFVTPVASEARLRDIDWIEGNQRKVDQLSGGKLAYVYLPNTGHEGITNFNRYYFAQTDKQGVIIDERFNGGGYVADYFIEVMKRQIDGYWSSRYGNIEHTPNAAIYGPKVMIANEISGSGGDALPWLFKQAKLGPLVGKRTWGGLVGPASTPVLMDGGHVATPSVAFFSPKGVWDVENHGVDPDVVVEQDPKAVSEGHDPQLEKAVALAMEGMKEHPAVQVERPAYPDYHH
jgi:tricorn protease